MGELDCGAGVPAPWETLVDISFPHPTEDQVAFSQPSLSQVSLLLQNLQELLIAYRMKFKL